MDILETTAASYKALAGMATFFQGDKPSREAYLLFLKEKPTNSDRKRLTKELVTLRMYGEEMSKEIMLMGQPRPKEDLQNARRSGENDR